MPGPPGQPEGHGPGSAAAPAPPAPGSVGYFVVLYCPQRARTRLQLLLALEAELAAGLRRGLEHELAHARLHWWREQAVALAQDAARHPWLRGPERPSAATLQGLVDAAVIDLAESRLPEAIPGRRLRAALFLAVGALLEQATPAQTQSGVLEHLGMLAAGLEWRAADPDASKAAALATALGRLEPQRQPALAPLLVWCALLAAHAARRRPGGRPHRFRDALADNLLAWRTARAAGAARLTMRTGPPPGAPRA